MHTPLFTRPAALLSRLDAAAAALTGKKGAPAARALAARIRAAAYQHEQQLRMNRVVRSARTIAATRRRIEQWRSQTWQRGAHGELRGVQIPKRFWTHPALKALAAPLALFERAKSHVLPEPYAAFDPKGRGTSLSLDLYGFGFGLLLVQVRTSRRRAPHGFLSIRKDYLLTDGCDCTVVQPARIKRAAAQDPRIESPIRALKLVLPPAWADRIEAEPLKCAMPITRYHEAYKVVEQKDTGQLVSVYDGSPWPLGEWRTERARRDHGSGLYAYARLEEAQYAAQEGRIFNRVWSQGKTLVLVRCEVGGGGRCLRYGLKRAFHALRPVEILGVITHAI